MLRVYVVRFRRRTELHNIAMNSMASACGQMTQMPRTKEQLCRHAARLKQRRFKGERW